MPVASGRELAVARMEHSTSISRRPSALTATIPLGGQDFTFKLYTRSLSLGPETVQYYWLDSRPLRRLGNAASAANFCACLGHWGAAMRASGLGNDLEQQIDYVTAQCYPLVSNCKRLQAVYRDAYLAPRRGNPVISLSRAVRLRIRDIAASQDRFRVQEELDRVLGGFEPPARVLPLLQEAFRRWVGKGVVLMRARGNDGLKLFLREADYWLSTYRKRSGRWVRHFINLFAYEAKVSFYRCYANAWIDLIPWLQKHHGLDPVSERFLRFWHHQNQPIEIPHGRTVGGIYYPTHGRATVFAKGRDGRAVRRSLTWETPHIGPTHVRDVFRGQVLSLHPLSGFFMQDAKACAAAGRFFTCDGYEDVMVRGSQSCPEYWDLIGAILAAAHRYRQALDEQEQQRRGRPNRSGAIAALAGPDSDYSQATLLEDFAAHRKVRCPKCAGTLRLERYHWPAKVNAPGRAEYRCRGCNHPVTMACSQPDLERFVFGVN